MVPSILKSPSLTGVGGLGRGKGPHGFGEEIADSKPWPTRLTSM